VELGDAQGLLAKAVKTTQRHPTQLQSNLGLVVWTSQGPLPRRVLEQTTTWAPGTTRLVERLCGSWTGGWSLVGVMSD
jgi:hypothetical protein